MARCCSAATLPARNVADAAVKCMSRIDRLRTEAVDELVMPRVEASKQRRFFGLLEPKPLTRDEVVAQMRRGDIDACFAIAGAEHRYARQYNTAERLLNLAKAALRCDEAATMMVSSEDFDAIEQWYTND